MQAGESSQNYARDILDIEVQRGQAAEDWQLAKLFYQSGIFSDMKNKSAEEGIATAFAKIQLGRGWGMNAGDAMQFLYFDKNGRPQVMSEYIAARMRRAGYAWDIVFLGAPDKCTGVTLHPKFQGSPITEGNPPRPATVTFSEADAKAAGLLDKDGPWKTYRKDMYYWKAIARMKRYYATDVLAGVAVAELDEQAEYEPTGSREAQQAVLARKLKDVAEFDAKKAAANGATSTKPEAPEAGSGDFFS